MNLRLICFLFLFAGCQSSPSLMLTPGQQQELDSIAIYVTQQAKALRKDNMRVNRDTVDRLLKDQDTAVMSMLNDEQWDIYDTSYRDRFASKIYQYGVRPRSSRYYSGVNDNRTSVPISSSQQQ